MGGAEKQGGWVATNLSFRLAGTVFEMKSAVLKNKQRKESMMEKEKLKYPYLGAVIEITQILLSDVIQTSGKPSEESWDGSNVSSNGWTAT